MPSNLFSNSPLIWSALLGAALLLPFLIHLINRVRQRRIEWAAMEFLLRSYRKRRNWVWLQQLLLLLARMAILSLALVMLAQPSCRQDRWSAWLGGSVTHHYVLLDDSFSMGQRDDDGSAMDRALAALSRIAARASRGQQQRFTLIRTSTATEAGRPASADMQAIDPDLNGRLVDSEFAEQLESLKGNWEQTSTAAGLAEGLSWIESLRQAQPQEQPWVYVLSDFRRHQWQPDQPVWDTLRPWLDSEIPVELIDCAPRPRPNLAITGLRPIGKVRVAQTPLMMEVEVTNVSSMTIDRVPVELATWQWPAVERFESADRQPLQRDLPTVFLESVAPGQSVKQQFSVYFDIPGQHDVLARLPDDSLAADNEATATVSISDVAPVLVIDDESQVAGSLMALALNPGGTTGLQPELQTRAWLRDATSAQLERFDALFLLDVEPLPESAVERLEAYVRQGGGVAFYLGPAAPASWINDRLYRDGQGLFPLPLDRPADVPERLDAAGPDVVPGDNELFAPARSTTRSLLDLVQIRRLWRPAATWSTDGADVLATLRGQADWPLVLQRQFGQGQVVVWTTTAAPIWNNWLRNATFVPITLLLEERLASGRFPPERYQVGQSLEWSVPSQEFQSRAALLRPGERRGEAEWETVELQLDAASSRWQAPAYPVSQPGPYEQWFLRQDGEIEVRRRSFQLDPRESQMESWDAAAVVAGLEGPLPQVTPWDQFDPDRESAEVPLSSRWLLGLLVLVLILEQYLAYRNNYHAR